jgi:hypothetical protein
MKARIIAKIAVTIAATVLLFCPTRSFSCGPFFDEAIFSFQYHPDFPLKLFAAGKLGVVRPTFARSYLFCAYRELAGKPLNANEQSAIVALWEARMNNYDQSNSDAANPVKLWLDARNKIAGSKKIDRISTDRVVGSTGDDVYNSYLNCPDDAFVNATNILQQKVTKYGAGSDNVRNWLQAQDQVFCHCSGPEFHYQTKKFDEEPGFPEAAPQGADSLTKADRNYQLAAAHFYAQQFDLAAQEFDAISKDTASPYHNTAPYLAARCMVRKGTLPKNYDLASLQNAVLRLSAIVDDTNSNTDLRHSARQLLSFIEYRLHPQASLQALGNKLAIPGSKGDFRQDVTDYTFLLDKFVGANPDDESPAPVKLTAIPKAAHSELTDWITLVESSEPAAGLMALQRWQESKSVLWLVPAIMHAQSGAKESNELVGAALNLPASSPAYFTARYYALRLLIESKKMDEARKALTEVLATKNISPSSFNLFLDQQAQLATSLAEYWRDVVRTTSGASSDSDGLEVPSELGNIEKNNTYYLGATAFSPKAANVLNEFVSLDALRTAPWANWPVAMRRDYMQALWTRAVLLDDDSAIKQLTPLLAAQQPLLTKLLNEYKTTINLDQRKFLSTYILISDPAMRPYITPGAMRQAVFNQIEDYHDNWWCASETPSREQDMDPKQRIKTKPTFLSATPLAEAAAEQKRLISVGPGPTYLLTELIKYAKQPGIKDKRLPEALYHAIRSPKFGCVDKSSTGLSKTAFAIMHKQYPNDPWTKKTQYWY